MVNPRSRNVRNALRVGVAAAGALVVTDYFNSFVYSQASFFRAAFIIFAATLVVGYAMLAAGRVLHWLDISLFVALLVAGLTLALCLWTDRYIVGYVNIVAALADLVVVGVIVYQYRMLKAERQKLFRARQRERRRVRV